MYSENFILTDNVIRNIHNYNREDRGIYWDKEEYKNILTKRQLDILKAKYPDAIDKFISLPNEVFRQENEDSKYFNF